MNTFRGTNPQRHPWYVREFPEVELPPECKVTQPAPEVHVPTYENRSRKGYRIYVPVCSCGWRGHPIAYKNRAIERALNHAKENNGNVALDS